MKIYIPTYDKLVNGTIELYEYMQKKNQTQLNLIR